MNAVGGSAGNLGDGVAQLLGALAEPDRARLGPGLSRLDWVAPLPNAAAPGFLYLAGALDGAAAGGGGRTPAEAAGRLAGEAAEAAARAEPPLLRRDLPGDPEIDAIWTRDPKCARIAASDPQDGAPVGLPAVSVFSGPELDAERRPEAPPGSLGLAAGPSQAAARLSGLLELVERDAAARWWAGLDLPRALDPGLAANAASELAAMRRGASPPGRATTLLRLEARCGVPVVCAFSSEPDGRGLAIGLKAALEPAVAARGAVMELLQMEIALEMARMRHTRGEPTAGDASALDRAALDLDALPAFSARPARAMASRRPLTGMPELVRALAREGIRIVAADLDAPGMELHVAKIAASGLMPFPSGHEQDPRPGAPGKLARLMG